MAGEAIKSNEVMHIQARRIMASVYGAEAIRGKKVHHKDFNPQNNDISNLEIVTHAEHGERHRKSKPLGGVALFIRNFPDDLHKMLKTEALKRDMRLYEFIIFILKSFWEKERNDS